MTMNTTDTDWIGKWATYSPHKIALKEDGTERMLSYLQLNIQANRLAKHLVDNHQLAKGDRIAILAENCLEYFILFSVAQKTGCTLVPLNYRLTSSELSHLLALSDPKLTIVEGKFQEKLVGVESHLLGTHNYALREIADLCTDASLSEHFSSIALSPDDPVFILFTSGTTGFPKGAIYTHKMLFWNSINTSLSLFINTESRSIHCLPPFHTGGWNVLSTPILHHGGYLCVMKKFEPQRTLQLLEHEQITLFMGVPTMLKMMSNEPDFSSSDLSALYYLIVGGESMPIPLIEKWHKKGIPVRQGYGMTEVGPNLTSLHHEDGVRKKGSIGFPNFYVQIEIVNEQGQQVSNGDAGELLIRGPMVTPGYWRDKKATQEAFTQDWFRSGDIARADAEGYLYIVDRIKNMYISGGENIYPTEIERTLNNHAEISEVAVVGIPDAKWGEVGKAFVVKVESSELTVDQIITYCQAHLASFKIPKSFTFLSTLPKMETGKIDRMALREDHIAG